MKELLLTFSLCSKTEISKLEGYYMGSNTCELFQYQKSSPNNMTTQQGNRVLFKGETYYTYSDPFQDYLNSLAPKERPYFHSVHTANQKGYDAVYEVRGDKLFLINFAGNMIYNKGGKYYFKNIGLETLFPGQKENFTDWFTGGLRLETTDQLIRKEDVGPSYSEDELYLQFKDGILEFENLVNSKVLDRISSLEDQLWYQKNHGKKKTIWYYIARRFFRRKLYDMEEEFL